jgi:glutaredoxin
MYYIHTVLLENCPYSNSSKILLDKYNIKYTNTIVNHSNKELFKTDKLQTFPQVFLKKVNNKGSVYIGGYNDFDELFRMFYKQKLDDKKILTVQNKYKMSKKGVLRLIGLINNY